MSALADRWIEAEAQFEASDYDGVAPADCAVFVDRTHPVLITAPHAVNHHRFGAPKWADRRTGGLALLLGELTGAAVLVAAGRVSDWSSWAERDDDFAEHLRAEVTRRSLVIDLHGMGDRHGVDFCIGTGGRVDPETEAALASVAAELGDWTVGRDDPFDGDGWFTVRTAVTKLGGLSLQLEVAAALRDPAATPDVAERVVESLVATIDAFAARA